MIVKTKIHQQLNDVYVISQPLNSTDVARERHRDGYLMVAPAPKQLYPNYVGYYTATGRAPLDWSP